MGFWFSLFDLGVCNNNQGAEPCEGAAAGAGGGDHGTQGWEKQHKGENHLILNSTSTYCLLFVNEVIYCRFTSTENGIFISYTRVFIF